ncbi:MAG: secretin and TonB N-terminal domain-containing protein, partial [Legionella sp.]|nr:secretin and TonB N-terminal domain-containing protein [Legionella sp.]
MMFFTRSLVILCVALCCVADRSPARGAESRGQEPAPRRFSLEFRDADIKDVLRLLGQENDLNILVGDDVTGKVTVSFKEVTLDQALLSILQSFGYSYSKADGIVLVTKSPVLGKFVSRAVKIRYLVDSVSVSNDTSGSSSSSNTGSTSNVSSSGGITSTTEGNQAQSAIVEKQLAQLAKTLEPMLSAPPPKDSIVTSDSAASAGDSKVSGDRRSDFAQKPGIQVFPRINTLVITDTPERVDRIVAL